jgi:hypothetical protein
MRLVISAALLIACGSGDPAAIDAPPHDATPVDAGPCWPELTHTPRGSATLGTGWDTYQPIPEELPLEYGVQDGFMLIAHARMTGFDPGNPNNIYDETNLRTRIRAYFDETDIPLNYYAHCAWRYPYLDSGTGDYVLYQGAPVIFEVCWRSAHLFGQRIRIELEILDDDGGYTTDVKVVTALPPVGPHAVDDGPPCMH